MLIPWILNCKVLYIYILSECVFVFQVLCNGPGTCVPLCAAGLLLGVLGLKRVLIVYVESICRVETLSLSGNILYYFSDCFFVQWAPLKDKYPKAIYLGRLVWSLSVDFFTFFENDMPFWYCFTFDSFLCSYWRAEYTAMTTISEFCFFKPNDRKRLMRCPVLPFAPLKSQQNQTEISFYTCRCF